MPETTGGITEERVREEAARLRALLERWRSEGSDPAKLDVEAAARRALRVRTRPKPSAHEVLGAVRPGWEEEPGRRELTGGALNAFTRQILEDEGPEIQCEMSFPKVWVHLNASAAELAVQGSSLVEYALDGAVEEIPELSLLVGAILSLIDLGTPEIASAAAEGNGQVCLVWNILSGSFSAEPDSGWVFEVHNALGSLFG